MAAEFLRGHHRPVLDVADALLSGLPDGDVALLADALEQLASVKDADAAARPGPSASTRPMATRVRS